MFKTLRHYASVAACFARLAIQRQIEYPLFLVSWFIMIPIMYTTGILLLYILTDRFQPLAGWTFPQLAFVYGLGDISHGLMVVLFIQTWSIESFVVRGEFDRMLLRPMNVFFQFITRYLNFIGLMDMMVGIIIFAYACRLLQFQWTAVNAVKVILVVLGAALIRAALYTIVCSVAFWTKRSRPLVGLVHDMMERTTLYPITIYPYAIQMILTFLIPVGFISFYPASDFLGQNASTSFPLEAALWTPVVGILMFTLANLVFKTGLNRYESAGS